MGIIARPNNWIDYANAVGNFNRIHRKDVAAQEYDLDGMIAPGMWLVSHIQRKEKISGVKEIKFFGNVFDGDYFEIKSTNGKPGERNYKFRCENKKVCDIKGVRNGNYESPAPDLKEILYEHKTDIRKDKIDNYWRSIGHHNGDGRVFPDMYLASLFAPALLGFSEEKGLGGFHASQSFKIHKDYCEGDIEFLIGDKKKRSPLSFLELRGYQNGDMVISGRAGIVPFGV